MLLQSSYLTYKRETSRLVFLLVTASNAILSVKNAKAKLNTSGKLDSSGFVPSAELIGKHMRSVPREILRLLKSVIELRTSHYAEFERRVSANPNFKMEESNKSHKHFIDVLSRAFQILGGEDELKRQRVDKTEPQGKEVSDQEYQATCLNMFAHLTLDRTDSSDEGDDDDEASVCDAGQRTTGNGRATKSRSKSTKSKKGKCSRGRNPTNKKHKDQKHLGGLSLEQYGILDDDSHVAAEYFLAVSSFLEQSIDLRLHCQHAWYQVAYETSIPIAAVATSEQCIAMIQRSHKSISSDFPGSHAYVGLINAFTRGGIDKLQQYTTIRISGEAECSTSCQSMIETPVSRESMRELLMEHTYNDLVEFLRDYQTTSSGVPTKPMQAEISRWDPTYDLCAATADQRRQWRRVYTINWLYGLIGYYFLSKKYIDVGDVGSKPLHSPRRKVTMPWAEDYSFFGLGEFARSIITLARRPAGSSFESMISPCLVFRLQCIVDSFNVSRGWIVEIQQDDLRAPPGDDKEFCNRGAMEWFTKLTCPHECEHHQGLARSKEWLRELHSSSQTRRGSFGKDTMKMVYTSWARHYRFIIEIGHGWAPDFQGNSTKGRLDGHGLFTLSPYLCGLAILQTIELFYRYAMFIWDTTPEIVLILHLHNMLHQTGILEKPVELMAKLTGAFKEDLFGGNPPISDFYQAFIHREGASRFTAYSLWHPLLISTPCFKQFHMSERLFKTRSSYLVFHEAGWETDAVSPLRIESLSEQARLRDVIDDLQGRSLFDTRKRFAKAATPGHAIDLPHFDPDSEDIHEVAVLGNCNHALRRDLCVCCPAPLSAVNFLAVTAKLLSVWIAFEKKLKLKGHVLSDGVGPAASTPDMGPVESVLATALRGDDDGLGRLLAEVFEETRANVKSVSYFTSNEQ
ncbi:hypothetical protein E4U21_007040 [Claviceps maximensis]|nr:hypothetical protein E4U21_007040 [Claviceps maximensis]